MQGKWCPYCDAVTTDRVYCEHCESRIEDEPMRDFCDYPECDREVSASDDSRCQFHYLVQQQTLGEQVSDKQLESAFME